MKTITIIFMGLIAHVNQPWSLNNTAVVPNAPGHKAEMRIPKSAVISVTDPWLVQKLDQDTYVIPLKGLNVHVNKTRGIFAGLSPELIAAMPPLKALAPKCKLKDEVRKRTVSEALASFIDYRGGKLTPVSYFPEKLEIQDTAWSDGRCVVCRVRYEADLSGDEGELLFVEADGTKHVTRIAANSVMEVNNTPIVGQGGSSHGVGPGSDHFENHYSIFQPCDRPQNASTAKVCDKKQLCSQPSPPFPLADCTNSHYP